MDNKFDPDDLQCLVGTMSGKLVKIQTVKGGLFSGFSSLWGSAPDPCEVLFQPKGKDDFEGKVISVAYKLSFAIWATPK